MASLAGAGVPSGTRGRAQIDSAAGGADRGAPLHPQPSQRERPPLRLQSMGSVPEGQGLHSQASLPWSVGNYSQHSNMPGAASPMAPSVVSVNSSTFPHNQVNAPRVARGRRGSGKRGSTGSAFSADRSSAYGALPQYRSSMMWLLASPVQTDASNPSCCLLVCVCVAC